VGIEIAQKGEIENPCQSRSEAGETYQVTEREGERERVNEWAEVKAHKSQLEGNEQMSQEEVIRRCLAE
jgi:hypothetical protein